MRVSELVLLEPEGGVLIKSSVPGGATARSVFIYKVVADTGSKERGLLPRCDRPSCEQKGDGIFSCFYYPTGSFLPLINLCGFHKAQ